MKFVLFLSFCAVVIFYADSCRKDKNNSPSNLSPKSTASPIPTLNEEQNSGEITIDFEHCAPETRGVAVAFGSTTYKIVGKVEGDCLMEYGGEVENPLWDGFLDKHCKVPVSLGKQRFSRNNEGVNFYSLEPYCQIVSRPKK